MTSMPTKCVICLTGSMAQNLMSMRQACGLDKDSAFMCILNGKGVVFHCKYGILTPELEHLLDKIKEYNAEEVCMENTSIYWIPIWRILEDYVSIKLENHCFIKQLQGKKSDIKDLIKGSYS